MLLKKNICCLKISNVLENFNETLFSQDKSHIDDDNNTTIFTSEILTKKKRNRIIYNDLTSFNDGL